MKREPLAAVLGFSLIPVTLSMAQGTVNFANVAGPAVARTVDAPVFSCDGVNRISGADWAAMLYAGPSASTLEPVGPAVPFLTGAGAGYFQGGTRSIPNIAPGTPATIVIRVWYAVDAPTWEQALYKTESSAITVITGGAGSPPSLPANLMGLQSFGSAIGGPGMVCIPEPLSNLFALGAFVMLVAHRKMK